MINAAIIGGGVPTLIALGGYQVVCDDVKFDTFSASSMGAVCITGLAVGKNAIEIAEFLEKHALLFCISYVGKVIIRREVDKFLGNLKFKDLPVECYVSVSKFEGLEFPTKPKFRPIIITRENSENMTVGEVVAASATVPGLYFHSTVEINGKRVKVYDGGLSINPPLNSNAKNALFSYQNPASQKPNCWNVEGRWPQEQAATAVFNPYTKDFHMLGGAKSVRRAFEFGRVAMQEQKSCFIETLMK